MKDRRFVACEKCLRQFDVTWLDTGQRLRCACGHRVPIKHHAPHAPRVQRCSGCGADLQDGSRTCSFCKLVIAPDERRLTSICPACFARMASDASFCMECGVPIEPQALIALPEDAACPSCDSELSSRTVNEVQLVDCATCGGLWLPPDVFDELAARAVKEQVPDRIGTPVRQTLKLTPETRYRKCPICAAPMTRRNYAGRSGVVIDLCTKHGVWFDRDELEHILTFIRTGGSADVRSSGPHPGGMPPPSVVRRLKGEEVDSLFGDFGAMAAAFLFMDLFD